MQQSNTPSSLCNPDDMAEREGFEPPIPFQVCRFSRPVPSTTRPPLQLLLFYYSVNSMADNSLTGIGAVFCLYDIFSQAPPRGSRLLRKSLPQGHKGAQGKP